MGCAGGDNEQVGHGVGRLLLVFHCGGDLCVVAGGFAGGFVPLNNFLQGLCGGFCWQGGDLPAEMGLGEVLGVSHGELVGLKGGKDRLDGGDPLLGD